MKGGGVVLPFYILQCMYLYIVDKIKFFGTESVKVAEQNLNYWNANLYEFSVVKHHKAILHCLS